MKLYYGVVEDRQDPLKIGRVRVRVHNVHTHDKNLISTPDLPWAHVVLPTTSAGLSGFGTQHGLVEGSTVLLYFKDDPKNQQPVILGSTTGIPVEHIKESSEGELQYRNTKHGFNDPRRLTSSEYDGTPDGKNPEHSSKRGFGLTTALDTAPKKPKKIDINPRGGGGKIEEQELKESDLPFYPLKEHYNKSDLSPQATEEKDLWNYTNRNVTSTTGVTLVSPPEIKSPADPKYPYNKVIQTESGHMVELDDTPKKERIAVEHRSGTYHEIYPDGTEVTRVVNDNYTVVCKDNTLWVGGNVNIQVQGKADITTLGDVNLKSYGNGSIEATKDLLIKAGNKLTLEAPETVRIRSKKFTPNA